MGVFSAHTFSIIYVNWHWFTPLGYQFESYFHIICIFLYIPRLEALSILLWKIREVAARQDQLQQAHLITLRQQQRYRRGWGESRHPRQRGRISGREHEDCASAEYYIANHGSVFSLILFLSFMSIFTWLWIWRLIWIYIDSFETGGWTKNNNWWYTFYTTL